MVRSHGTVHAIAMSGAGGVDPNLREIVNGYTEPSVGQRANGTMCLYREIGNEQLPKARCGNMCARTHGHFGWGPFGNREVGPPLEFRA